MLSIRLIALFCFVQSISGSGKNLTRSYYFPNSHLLFKETSFKNTTVTYVLCDKSFDQVELNCTVTREDNDLDGVSKKSSCNLTLQYDDALTAPQVTPFGKDKAVLTSSDIYTSLGQILKFTTIQFPSCQKNEDAVVLSIDDQKLFVTSQINVLTYEDRFEAFFESNSLCRNKVCKVIFNSDGKVISGPYGWVDSHYGGSHFLYPFSSQWPAKGYLLVSEFFGNHTVYLIRGDEVKLLQIVPNLYFILSYSACHDFLSICTMTETVTCTQYDQTGNAKFAIASNTDFILLGSSLHNLPSGGFLLATFTPMTEKFSIKKFNADGKKMGAAEVPDFKCTRDGYIVHGQFFETADGQYCLTLACFELLDLARFDKGHIDLATNCFTDRDFS